MFVCVCVQCLLESASPELRVWSSSVPYLNISTLGMTVLVKASGQFHCGSQGTPTILFETVHCHSFQPFSREFRKRETLMGWVLTCFDAPNTTNNIVFSHLCFASLLYRSVIPPVPQEPHSFEKNRNYILIWNISIYLSFIQTTNCKFTVTKANKMIVMMNNTWKTSCAEWKCM